MAGHSKWAKLKHTKGKTDAQKAKMFSKLVRQISIEAKKAKGDRTAPGVRLAIEKAREANMPADNIERALSKSAAGEAELESVTYEAYGPGGAALIIDGYTNNRNRTAQEIKFILSQHESALAAPGAAMWAFQKTDAGLTATATAALSDDDLEKLSKLVDALEDNDDVNEVYTNAE